jgi:hypothetical protein
MRCRIVTADDPENGDVDDFDYRENPHCPGYRSLILLTSATRELGECGRAASISNAMKMLGLAAGMTEVKVNGRAWLQTYRVPVTTTVAVRANFNKRQVLLDLTNPDTKDVLLSAIAWANANSGPNGLVATVTVDGVDLTYRVKFARGAAEAVARRYE